MIFLICSTNAELHNLSVLKVERAYKHSGFDTTDKEVNEIAAVLTQLIAVGIADFC